MAHNPVNHPARPIYRAIGGLTGAYLAAFGVAGVIATSGEPFFSQSDMTAFGQGTNLANSVLSLLLGLVVLAGAAFGRNFDCVINKWSSWALLLVGGFSLAFMQTEINILNFSVATVVVAWVLSMVLLMAGMYGKVGNEDDHKAWQAARLEL